MDSPNAKANTSTGSTNHTEPVGSNRSSPDRCPSWNTHTSAPKLAPSDSTFMTRAFTGTTTEPVIRNSSTNVASATNPRTSGRREISACLASTVSAACPVTSVSNGAGRDRIDATSRKDASVSATARGTTSTRATRGPVATTSARTTPGSVRRRSRYAAYADRGTPASRTATTWIGSDVCPGKCRCTASKNWRLSEDRGRYRESVSWVRAWANGATSRTSPAMRTGTRIAARRWTSLEIRKNAPWPSARAAAGRILRPQIESSAGTSVTAAAIATTTTPMPPYATDRNPPVRNSSPESDAVTVSPENTMVRARGGHGPFDGLGHVEPPGPFLPEPADRQ